jgi:predicted ferric reductase
MYILGAKSVMGLIFKDLASVLRIHKWLGRWGSLAILAHPLLITLSYGESLLYPILPHIGTQFERHVTLGRIAIYILLLTWVVSWFFKKRLSFRFWKYLHLLAYICLPFAILHVPDTGSQLMAHNSVKVYFLTLVLTFVVFSIIRLRGFLNLDKKPYVVLEQTHIQNGDYLLRLKPLGRPLRPNRGQYVYLKLGLISEDHPFSVLEYSEDSGELRIAYRVYGAYTKELTLLRVNDKVFVGGPYGDFLSDIPDSDRPTVYISGGIGITPFVDHIMHNDIQHEQWLFAANRSPDTALFLSDVAPPS